MSKTKALPVYLAEDQVRQLLEYGLMLVDVNKHFNLISREDSSQVMSRHISHCLTIAERTVPDGARVVDWGSGGGLPAIPLAIAWPHATIVAVDSNGKKTRAVDMFCRRLGISNCTTWNGRAEEAEGSFQYSVSRATAPLKDLWTWHERIYQSGAGHEPRDAPKAEVQYWKEGLLCLKGGDLKGEIKAMNQAFQGLQVDSIPLKALQEDPFFETKILMHVWKEAVE